MKIIPDNEGEPPAAALTEQPAPAPEPAPEAAAPPVAEGEEAPALETPPAAPAPKAPSMVPLRVLQERVGEVTRKKDAELEDRDRKIRDYEAILARVQTGNPPPPTEQPRAAAPASPAPGDASFEDAVNRTVTAREASRSISAMVTMGRNEFTPAEWNEKAEVLGAVGAATPEFVMDVIAADPANAHKIIFALAQDPERAASLANMDIRQRTAELTRMSMAEQAKTNPPAALAPEAPRTQISRAPAPKPPIAPHAPAQDIDPTTPEGNEKMSDQQFEKWYKEKHYKKA